jgi:hypothetical protein
VKENCIAVRCGSICSNPSTLGLRQEDHEFEASLGYTENSRKVESTQQDLVLKKKAENHQVGHIPLVSALTITWAYPSYFINYSST